MNKCFVLYLFFFSYSIGFAQEATVFLWPIDTPHVITGNYGELRPNHFHMGWDFSTGGKINYPVYAIADGYVSRIKVSSVGYGKAVYITHPDNKLSLFAHLNSFAGAIAETVKTGQTTTQNYEIEMLLYKNEIQVRKGQLIGYSGNTGGSTGPHLHFEIRNQKTEVPLNLLEFYKLPDTLKPQINQVGFYNLADSSNPKFVGGFKVKSKKGSLFLQNDSLVFKESILGFAFNGFDYFVSEGSANVIYKATLILDEEVIFSYALNNISFNDQRYANEFAETIQKIKYQKCFLPTAYPSDMYGEFDGKGRIILKDTNFHQLKLIVYDESNNQQTLQFFFKTRKINSYLTFVKNVDLFVDCKKDFTIEKYGILLAIPAKTLYYSTNFKITNTLKLNNRFSLAPPSINFANPVKIKFEVPRKFITTQKQLVLQNRSVIHSPVIRNDSLTFLVYTTGDFVLLRDTIAPKIKTQLSLKKIKKIKKFESFAFVIQDNLSGIAKYNLYVNNNWVLAEYDAKSNLLTYNFDVETPPCDLSFKVNTEDKAGNKSVFNFLLKR